MIYRLTREYFNLRTNHSIIFELLNKLRNLFVFEQIRRITDA